MQYNWFTIVTCVVVLLVVAVQAVNYDRGYEAMLRRNKNSGARDLLRKQMGCSKLCSAQETERVARTKCIADCISANCHERVGGTGDFKDSEFRECALQELAEESQMKRSLRDGCKRSVEEPENREEEDNVEEKEEEAELEEEQDAFEEKEEQEEEEEEEAEEDEEADEEEESDESEGEDE